MADEKPATPGEAQKPQPPAGEMSREEKIAAARAKAEALKAQRAAGGAAPPRPAPSTPGAAAAPAAALPRAWATSDNPGGQPATPPQNPKIEAFGTITQSVELRCEGTEDQNIRRLLGGLGLYRNPLRGVWQLDYRYYAEARRRLQEAGYEVDGKDYLGRPLERWAPETRGWTRLAPG